MDCPYCKKEATFMSTKDYYGRDYGTNIYVCKPCDATVGTHGRSKTPKGIMANKHLRELRRKVHRLFDPLWKSKRMSRKQAYRVLQTIMQMKLEEAHIAMFDENDCQKAIEKLTQYNKLTKRSV